MKTNLKKLAECKNQKMYLMHDNKDDFYALYELCRDCAERISSAYNGDYIVSSFQFETGEIVKVWFNDDLGVFSMIELV